MSGAPFPAAEPVLLFLLGLRFAHRSPPSLYVLMIGAPFPAAEPVLGFLAWSALYNFSQIKSKEVYAYWPLPRGIVTNTPHG